MKSSPAVDAYIARSAEFARPILERVRKLYHRACPEIEEVIKWGFPHFAYRGLVGSMAAFKKHVSMGFWKFRLMEDPHKILTGAGTTVGALQVSDVSELPGDKIMLEYIRQAIRLNEEGVKAPPRQKRSGEVKIPDFLAAALKKNKKASATFEAFSPSHRREYVEWLTEAKQEATRARRLATALEWLAEGKPRNWKYMKKK